MNLPGIHAALADKQEIEILAMSRITRDLVLHLEQRLGFRVKPASLFKDEGWKRWVKRQGLSKHENTFLKALYRYHYEA